MKNTSRCIGRVVLGGMLAVLPLFASAQSVPMPSTPPTDSAGTLHPSVVRPSSTVAFEGPSGERGQYGTAWAPHPRWQVSDSLAAESGMGARLHVVGIEAANGADAVRQRAVHTAENGGWDVYLPFYAYHPAWVYSATARDRFHDFSPGLGIGKHWTDNRGNQDLVYGMVFEESHGHAEPIVGYARIWNTDPLWGALRLGAGYTVGVTSRPDIFSGVPFPLALPLLSAQVGRLAVMSAIVPDTKGIRVALLWARYQIQ